MTSSAIGPCRRFAALASVVDFVAFVAFVACTASIACTSTDETRADRPGEEPTAELTSTPAIGSKPSPGTALATLGELTVKGRAPKTGYSRDAFGSAWVDVDHNGCDTRSDILARDLSDVDGDGCRVLGGRLDDPYTGETITYTRGASEIDIDHVVALGNAWVTGAAYWTDDERRQLANDPLNLLAVSASANRSKGDSDTASWLPPAERARCRYVARQVAVKAKHGLWVTAAEKAAAQRVLASCPDEPTPKADPAPVRAVRTRKAASVRARTKGAKAAKAAKAVKRYRTCEEAKAAGAGPFVKGRDPEYSLYRDADHDGAVCE